jgi:hypothetical protein
VATPEKKLAVEEKVVGSSEQSGLLFDWGSEFYGLDPWGLEVSSFFVEVPDVEYFFGDDVFGFQ